ncbi:hypothetical protein SUNI508_00932 [Seiridium unicorne]|uniref:FAD-binding domain-containing protein n=1 Tax=Seiridium unicorne TaxID=138068 RepID=A0ABR2V1V5_9PEZI
MRVIIVGAGLGGLSAGICFALKGHDVEILEQRGSIAPAGGGLNIRPSATQIMHSWGLKDELERISEDTPSNCFRSLQTGAVATKTVATDIANYPDWGTHRRVLMQVLEKRARDTGATLTFNASVVGVQDDELRAIVILQDGRKIHADLVLAADGIRSRLRKQILKSEEGPLEPSVSDITLYGVEISEDAMNGVPELEKLKEDVYINIYMGHNAFIVSRFNSKLHCHGCLFGIKGETDQMSLWDERGDINYVRGFFRNSCPEMRKVLEVAKSCERWRLAEMPDLSRWSSDTGRVVLLGDSAHAMHPNAAQGFSQIVEDIGVLEYLVTQSSQDTSMHEITSDWEQIRMPRVERIKRWAKANSETFIGQPATGTKQAAAWHVKSLKDTKPDMNANMNSSAFLKWAQSYDAIEELIIRALESTTIALAHARCDDEPRKRRPVEVSLFDAVPSVTEELFD